MSAATTPTTAGEDPGVVVCQVCRVDFDHFAWPAGAPLPPAETLAPRWGTSATTVRRALTGLADTVRAEGCGPCEACRARGDTGIEAAGDGSCDACGGSDAKACVCGELAPVGSLKAGSVTDANPNRCWSPGCGEPTVSPERVYCARHSRAAADNWVATRGVLSEGDDTPGGAL